MSIHRYKIVINNIKLTKKILSYFLSEISNRENFEEIKHIAKEQTSEGDEPNGIGYIEVGYFSISDFLMYLNKKNDIEGGVNMPVVESVVEALVEEKFLNVLPETIRKSSVKRYKACGDYAKFFYDKDLIVNTICGWRYIIDHYNNSVFKIEHEGKDGDFSIGTGFYYADESHSKFLIITNRHVLENAKNIKLLTKEDVNIDYTDIKIDKNRDLGYIVLKKPLEEVSNLHLNSTRDILSEVLTIGYPSIPMTKFAYQVYHKGELNSYVEDYYDNKLFLFSAKTSSGNSGSPIIDRYGMVIGIVTEELFEQEQFQKKGKLPYYAGIPTEEIVDSLNEIFFN